MAQKKRIAIPDDLTRWISDFRIRQLAAQYGAVQRKREIDISVFIWTLILGFTERTGRLLLGLRWTFERTLRIHSMPPFYDRFTNELIDLRKALVALRR